MRVLMIEDDRELCEAVAFQLSADGFSVDVCLDGSDWKYYVDQNIYDIILLDRLLPGTDGLSILSAMRNSGNNTPVIMVTAMNRIDDRITGLDHGADDYLAKPYSIGELTARIRAVLRRPQSISEDSSFRFSDLTLNPEQRTISANGITSSLSPKEYELAEFLLRNPNKSLSREQIFFRVWGADAEVEFENLNNYIYFFRKKLKKIKSRVVLTTVYGVGFRLEESPC